VRKMNVGPSGSPIRGRIQTGLLQKQEFRGSGNKVTAWIKLGGDAEDCVDKLPLSYRFSLTDFVTCLGILYQRYLRRFRGWNLQARP
jgi:hypothetical protein